MMNSFGSFLVLTSVITLFIVLVRFLFNFATLIYNDLEVQSFGAKI